MDKSMAHKIDQKERTEDVLTHSDVTFNSFALKPSIKNGLIRCGYINPSPIQLLSIPVALIGVDLVIQAKSGTGKTVVFAVTALQTLTLPSSTPQVLIISPTREIAAQIAECINQIGRVTEGLAVRTFVGGVDLQVDKKSLKSCNVVVGTPGRIKQLLESSMLKPSTIRLLVLDEADKLMESHFVDDINFIIRFLPQKKQMIASSATYPNNLSSFLTRYMKSPKEIRLGSNDPSLLGITQFYSLVESGNERITQVVAILDSIPFSQAMIFSNNTDKSRTLFDFLIAKGHAAGCISGGMTTKERSRKMEEFKSKNLRVLVSTDLCSRGIDAEHVDLVINLDIPYGSVALETYFHRIGRAGRFGSTGNAITMLVEDSHESRRFFKFVTENDLKVTRFSGQINTRNSHVEDYKKYLEMIEGEKDDNRIKQAELKGNIPRKRKVVSEGIKREYPKISLLNKTHYQNIEQSKRKKKEFESNDVQNLTESSLINTNLHDYIQPNNSIHWQSSSISPSQEIQAFFPSESIEEWRETSLPVFMYFLNPTQNNSLANQDRLKIERSKSK